MGNGYLEGVYAPVDTEVTHFDLAVSGTIPDHLDGRYLRNGPNPAGDIDPDSYNLFMGDGMVHGIRIRDGRAEWYRNRRVQTGRRKRPGAGYELIGANTHVIGHAGRTLALVEAGNASHELTDELDTVGPCDFDGTVRGGYTAHPLRDPRTGELHAVSYHFGRGNTVQYTVIGADGRARRTVDIEVAGSPMMHSFSLTRNYVLIYDLPVTFDPRQAVEVSVPRPLRPLARLTLSTLIGRVRVPGPLVNSMGRSLRAAGPFPYRWNSDYPARIGVMPREGGDVRWFDVEPCYVYHPINAYEDGTEIVIDLVRHSKTFDADLHGPDEVPTTLDRWTVDLAGGKVREERVCDRPQEYPRIDDRLVGERHRYGYVVEADALGAPTDTLLKQDLAHGTTRTRSFGRGKRIGEFVFEPNRPDAAEDDGVLMGFVHDVANGRSDLTMLDAASLETVANIQVPQRVPFGFHGNWVPTGS